MTVVVKTNGVVKILVGIGMFTGGTIWILAHGHDGHVQNRKGPTWVRLYRACSCASSAQDLRQASAFSQALMAPLKPRGSDGSETRGRFWDPQPLACHKGPGLKEIGGGC